MGPLPGFFGLRGAIGVAVGGGWVFRVFIGSWVDYSDVYYESSFWLGPCEAGTYLGTYNTSGPWNLMLSGHANY